MASEKPEILIAGAGVIGLTCGVYLRESGYAVKILSRELPPQTTSDVAAAIWFPYRADPPEKVSAWAKISFHVYRQLANVSLTGVSMVEMQQVSAEPEPDPWWDDPLYGLSRLEGPALPAGYVDGFSVTVPLIETPIYMPYLMTRFRAAGGLLDQTAIEDLNALRAPGRVVVNCTGLGARDLLGDSALFPIRGQVVRVAARGVKRYIADDSDKLAYILSRTEDVVLGGTAEIGSENPRPDPATTATILRRCKRLEPGLKHAVVLESRVGLRPGRSSIRLKWDAEKSTGPLLHNYGHGGSGFTLAWGCAQEVGLLLETETKNLG